jgi:hypothetical protein
MNADLLRYLTTKLQEEQEILSTDLGLGRAKDHGEYKYTCGVIRGLMIANNIITETLDRMEELDE